MRNLGKKASVLACLAGLLATGLAVAGPASADTSARNGDAVAVGSDTLEFMVDFALDGAPGVAGGYNNVGNNHRVFNTFATGDTNGRLLYDGTCGTPVSTLGIGHLCDSGTQAAANSVASTVVLRAGTNPVVRPNGSGAGVAALTNDGLAAGYQGLPGGSISFARMSRLPNSTEEANCAPTTTTCGGLHVYQVATDVLGVAHLSTGFNGPSLLSAVQLYHIFVDCTFTTWTQVGGTSGNTIHPLIPQSGSGTRNFFLNELQIAFNGSNTTPNPGACTRSVEEHDPTGIYQDSSPGDAIEPFSTGRLNLINGSTPEAPAEGPYFTNPGYCTSGCTQSKGAFTPSYLTLQPTTGTASDGNTVYTSGVHGLYIVFRDPDVSSTTPFQSGGTQNLEATLFAPFTGVFTSGGGQSEIKATGFTPAFHDCGVNPTTC